MAEPKIAAKHSMKVQLETGDHWWCACGESESQPLCDGSHQGTSFTPLKIVVDEPKQVSLCACKRTHTAPYCDGTHRGLG
jgi:CDGSH iron-sulfur domain-containing protein 3